VGDNGEKTFYIEVPNILYTLRDLGIWDLIYEHCSYFSATSLSKLFEKLNFGVINVNESYMGQFLSIEASTVASEESYQTYVNVKTIQDLVEKFAISFNQKIDKWKEKIADFQSQDKTVVAWGGGSKGVSFLNFLKTSDSIKHIVDINPRKTGKYVAGTGQKYIIPEELKQIRPDVVIIMNPVYKKEITTTLQEMGLFPEVLVA
jgi:FlaA1/EpsC-like NDP-sugar epimerase